MEVEAKKIPSNGKVNTAVALGAVGTGLGVLGGGWLGNILNGGAGNGQCCEHYVTEKEAQYMTALGIAQSEKYTAEATKRDFEALYAQTIRSDDQIKAVNASIADGLIQTSNALGALTADVKCLQREVDRNREESFRNLQDAKSYTDTRVDCVAKQATCEIEKVYLWTEGRNYVRGEVKVDPNQICGVSPLATGCCGAIGI